MHHQNTLTNSRNRWGRPSKILFSDLKIRNSDSSGRSVYETFQCLVFVFFNFHIFKFQKIENLEKLKSKLGNLKCIIHLNFLKI